MKQIYQHLHVKGLFTNLCDYVAHVSDKKIVFQHNMVKSYNDNKFIPVTVSTILFILFYLSVRFQRCPKNLD